MEERPPTGSAALALYESLGPWSRADTAATTWPLIDLCEALAGGSRLQDLEDVIRDSDDAPGWSVVLDVDLAPAAWLRWLGQFDGVQIPEKTGEAVARSRIKSQEGSKRGRPEAIRDAMRENLTGTQWVLLVERDGGPWKLTAYFRASEVATTEQAVVDAIRRVKPAGITLTWFTTSDVAYVDLTVEYATYSDLLADNPTYADLFA